MQEEEIQKDNILNGFYALSFSRPRRHKNPLLGYTVDFLHTR